MIVKVRLQTNKIKWLRNIELKYIVGKGNQEILCFACRLIIKVGEILIGVFFPIANALSKNRCARQWT